MSQDAGKAQSGNEAEARKYYKKGALLLKQRKYDDAKKELIAALKLTPRFPEALKALALLSKATGQMQQARKYFTASGVAFVQLKRFEDAGKLVQACQSSGVEMENPFQRTGDALRESQKYHKACIIFEKGLGIFPNDANLAAGYVNSRYETGDLEGAHEFLESFRKQYPDLAGRVRQLADIPNKASGSGSKRSELEDLADVEIPDDEECSDVVTIDKNAPHKSKSDDDDDVGDVDMGCSDGKEMRRSKRIPMADYSVRYNKRKDPLQVIDFCREGIGFKHENVKFKKGEELTLDLMGLEKIKIKKLHVVVRHITGDHVGCEFTKLSGRQRKHIDELLFKDDDKLDPFEAAIGGKDKKISFNVDKW